MTPNCTCPADSSTFGVTAEKLNRACYHQIARETMLLPIQIARADRVRCILQVSTDHRSAVGKTEFRKANTLSIFFRIADVSALRVFFFTCITVDYYYALETATM